jgi:4-amino-4-deoxychorismate synthase (2-amino-4-deoxychorismate-forming) component I
MSQIRKIESSADLLALHRLNPQRYPFLLQSVAHGSAQTRFDILFAFPGQQIRLDDQSQDFLQQLDNHWQAAARDVSAIPQRDLPFSGGWFVYLGYELAGQIEPSLTLPAADDGLPGAFAARIPAAVIVDRQQQQSFLIAEPGQESLLDQISADFAQLDVADSVSSKAQQPLPAVNLDEDEPQRYRQGVERIKDYIVEGDVFQVNLSRAWRGRAEHSPQAADIYASLCRNNPAPFAGLALIDDAAVISSSPERLVKVKNGRIETRPIAGTRPRGEQSLSDQNLKAELLAHPKERAEHIMLIDLERNDLGRVCVPGSMAVDELMVLESYAHVHHIVSNVCGQLRDGVTPGEVIRAVFPGGTITGCPKVRCMEIIAELEGEGRGAYTGAMGYLNHNGDMDLNILIRTITQRGAQIQLRAGAGIVADSHPQKELDETRAKARGMLLALGS